MLTLCRHTGRLRVQLEAVPVLSKQGVGLAKAFVDGLVGGPDYERHKLRYEMELDSLAVPEADSVAEAGRLVRQLPELWAKANLSERRKLLLTVLDAVYVDARGGRAVASIRPKAAFALLLNPFAPSTGSLRLAPA